MLGTQFYFATARKIVAGFGTLFNNLHVSRKDALDTEIQNLKVPLAFAPKHRYLARLRSDLALYVDNHPGVKITLPRLSYEMTNISYDPERQLNPLNYKAIKNSLDADLFLKQLQPAPFNFEFTLNVYSKHIEDSLQIVEQVFPYFSPHFNISIIDIPALDIRRDVPVLMGQPTMSDTYEGVLESTDERIITWEIPFTAKGYLYPPIQDAVVIKNFVGFLGMEYEGELLNNEKILDAIGVVVNPDTAAVDGVYTVDSTIYNGPMTRDDVPPRLP